MKRVLRMVVAAAGAGAGLFLGLVLYLGKPRAGEPECSKRMRFRMGMWGEALALLGYGLWHPHLLRPGATPEERAMPLPGDALVPQANATRTYAITIDEGPEAIWPWLVQMGDGRASWYAWSPVHIYPEYQRQVSPYTVNPAWQELRVGQILLDGDVLNDCNEKKGAWRVAELEEGRTIVFYSARDFVEGLEFDAESTRPEQVYGVTSWAFHIVPLARRQSRLLIRVRAEIGPPHLFPIAWFVFGNYDLVWERTILDGVKYRAEHCGQNIGGQP